MDQLGKNNAEQWLGTALDNGPGQGGRRGAACLGS